MFKQPSFPYPETRTTLWARSFGTVVLGLAAAFVSYSAYRVQAAAAETQRANAERDIELKQEDARFKEEAESARVATSVLPYLKCTADLQQEISLSLLTERYRTIFLDKITDTCKDLSPQTKEHIINARKESVSGAEAERFKRILKNAREYKAAGLDGPASRVFHDANTLVPPEFASKLNRDAISKAEEAYAVGEFSKSADLFLMGFAGIPTQP
jgi:zona occludens toxin (predicted ATPase)